MKKSKEITILVPDFKPKTWLIIKKGENPAKKIQEFKDKRNKPKIVK